MNEFYEKLDYINNTIDSIYKDKIKAEGEKASLESMLACTNGSRLILQLIGYSFLIIGVLLTLAAFVKNGSEGFKAFLSYSVPCFAVFLIFDSMQAKYRNARARLLLIEKRCTALEDAVNLFRADRELLLRGEAWDISMHRYIAPEPLTLNTGKGTSVMVLAAVLCLAVWLGNVLKDLDYNGIDKTDNTRIVLNDGIRAKNEAGSVIIPQNISAEENGDKTESTDNTNVHEDSKAAVLPDNTDSKSSEEQVKTVSYSWNYNFAKWSQSMEFSQKNYEYYKNKRRAITGNDHIAYIEEETDDEFIKSLAEHLCKKGEENGYDDFEQIELLVSFVQGLDYIPDKNENGEDEEYPKYPIETLYDKGGDCEDTSILLASLLRAKGYGTAILKLPEHVAVGIKGSPESRIGSYYELNGERYYYIETTTAGWEIGEIPDEYKGMAAEIKIVN